MAGLLEVSLDAFIKVTPTRLWWHSLTPTATPTAPNVLPQPRPEAPPAQGQTAVRDGSCPHSSDLTLKSEFLAALGSCF